MSRNPEHIMIQLRNSSLNKYICVNGKHVRVNYEKETDIVLNEPRLPGLSLERMPEHGPQLFDQLSDDYLVRIVNNLDPITMCTFRRVCKRFKRICDEIIAERKLDGTIRHQIVGALNRVTRLPLWQFDDVVATFGINIRIWYIYSHSAMSDLQVSLLAEANPNTTFVCQAPSCTAH